MKGRANKKEASLKLEKLERYTQNNEKKEQKARKISIEKKLLEKMKIRMSTIENV